MGANSITRWIGIGLLGLPLYGVLTFFSSLDPQPDPNTHYDAWARYVTTDSFLLTHLFLSDLGLILAIFGTFALGAHLASNWWAISAAIFMVGYACIVGAVFVLWGAAGSFLPGIDYPHPTPARQVPVPVAGTTSPIGPRVVRVATDERTRLTASARTPVSCRRRPRGARR